MPKITADNIKPGTGEPRVMPPLHSLDDDAVLASVAAQEAIRIIGEDRIPASVLIDLIRRFG